MNEPNVFKPESAMAWYNFATKEYEYLYDTPTDFTNYIPQDPSAIGLYECYIELGETPVEAAVAVLSVCAGK